MRVAALTLAVLIGSALSACSAPYLLRAAYEEARILWRRQPIDRLLARSDLDPETRDKLSLVLAARAFARERLGFQIGDSYATISHVDGNAVVHVVTAAYRDRLEAYTWRYPIVGRVPYRGFFEIGRADAYAASLEADGLDTAVWPSVAFSTLGWLDDPLLSSMLEADPVEVATVVFHELTHAQLYVPGAAGFNESFANFAGHRAAIDYFCLQSGEGGDTDAGADRCAMARNRWDDERLYAGVLAEAGEALRTLYAAGLSPAARDARRTEILATAALDLAGRPLRTPRYRDIGLGQFNNAVLLQQMLYRSQLSLFESLWADNDHDLRRTLSQVASIVESAADPFAALEAAEEAGTAAGRGGGAPHATASLYRR
jgi:predicted aminopeptidase